MRISFAGWAAHDAVAYELKGHFFVVAAGGEARGTADAFAAALGAQDRRATPAAQLASLIETARAHPGWAGRAARGAVAWVDVDQAWIGRVGQARSFRWRDNQLAPVGEGRVPIDPGDVLVLVCGGDGAVDAVGLVTVLG